MNQLGKMLYKRKPLIYIVEYIQIMDTHKKLPSNSSMSNKRMAEIQVMLQSFIKDAGDLKLAMANIGEIMKFDPEQKRYTKEQGKQHVQWKKKKAEEMGTSMYEASGDKKRYYARKLVAATLNSDKDSEKQKSI